MSTDNAQQPTSGKLTLSFRGIVSLVQDPQVKAKCEAESDAGWETWDKGWILLPNASDHLDIGLPDSVYTRHEARLLILEGTPKDNWSKKLYRCPTSDFKEDHYPGLHLDGRHVEIHAGVSTEAKLKVDKTSVEKLPYLDDLVSEVKTTDGERLESLPGCVFGFPYQGRSLMARFLLEHGELVANTLGPPDGERFRLVDTFTGQWQTTTIEYIGTSLVLTVPLTGDGDVTLRLKHLSTCESKDRRIKPHPVTGNISILVENAPATRDGVEGCRNGDPHFAYHYVMRPGYEKAVGVLVPESGQKLSGSNDNAQCSPVRDSG